MKKDRNTFFSEAQMSTQNYFPGPNNMNMQMANAPFQSAQASQSFYSGPAINPTQTPMPIYNNQNYDYNYYSEIENRLAKIERQINRLESRVSKLESQTFYSNDDYSNGNDTMYMV